MIEKKLYELVEVDHAPETPGPIYRIEGLQGIWYPGFSHQLDPYGPWGEKAERKLLEELVKILNLGGGWFVSQPDS